MSHKLKLLVKIKIIIEIIYKKIIAINMRDEPMSFYNRTYVPENLRFQNIHKKNNDQNKLRYLKLYFVPEISFINLYNLLKYLENKINIELFEDHTENEERDLWNKHEKLVKYYNFFKSIKGEHQNNFFVQELKRKPDLTNWLKNLVKIILQTADYEEIKNQHEKFKPQG